LNSGREGLSVKEQKLQAEEKLKTRTKQKKKGSHFHLPELEPTMNISFSD